MVIRLNYSEFIKTYKPTLENYWKTVSPSLMHWKQSYHWPNNVSLQKAVSLRNQLETLINDDLNNHEYLSKATFDSVMSWGFGRSSNVTANEIKKATQIAFNYLAQEKLKEAALALTRLPGIGISRASKILAISDQNNLGIYDSRAAHGLSDLTYDGFRIIPIPPGRVIAGDSHLSTEHFCAAFEQYTWLLKYFQTCCQNDLSLNQDFRRISDIEIAFFSRSRLTSKSPITKPSYIQKASSFEEGDCYFTLGYGDRAKPFWAYVDESGVTVLTGQEGKTACRFKHETIADCLTHFSKSEWFLLGNAVDNVKPGSLGEYFKEHFNISPKFASHFASILYYQAPIIELN